MILDDFWNLKLLWRYWQSPASWNSLTWVWFNEKFWNIVLTVCLMNLLQNILVTSCFTFFPSCATNIKVKWMKTEAWRYETRNKDLFYVLRGTFWETRMRETKCTFCSIVGWGDFELWKIANLLRNKKWVNLPLTCWEKSIFLARKGYEILWKISEQAQVRIYDRSSKR